MRFGYAEPVATTAADVSRNFGHWQDKAISGPVIVTHHGRARVVLISADQFAVWNDETQTVDLGAKGGPTSETSLAAVLDHISEGFIALDQDLVVTATNGVAEAFFGLSRSQLVGHRVLSVLPALEGSLVLDRIRRVLRSGMADAVEGKSPVFPDRWTRTRIFPYPGGVGMLMDNCTEAFRQQEVCRLAEAGAAALEGSTLTSFVHLNVRAVIVAAGARFCEVVGLSPEEVVGARLSELIAVGQRRPLQEALETVLQQGRPLTYRADVLTKNAAEVGVEFSITPLVNGYTSEGAYVLAAFDR